MGEATGETEVPALDRSELLLDLHPLVRRALVARYGVDVGRDAAAEAVAWGWEHVDRLATMANPAGYLYRVGQSAARKLARQRRAGFVFPTEPVWSDAPDLSEDIFEALRRLRREQRVVVLLVHGYGLRYRDAADLLGISEASVRNHVHRGLRKLRSILETDS